MALDTVKTKLLKVHTKTLSANFRISSCQALAAEDERNHKMEGIMKLDERKRSYPFLCLNC